MKYLLGISIRLIMFFSTIAGVYFVSQETIEIGAPAQISLIEIPRGLSFHLPATMKSKSTINYSAFIAERIFSDVKVNRPIRSAKPQHANLRVNGIFVEGKRKFAVVNGGLISEGSLVSGYRVVSINPSTVTLKRDGKLSVLAI